VSARRQAARQAGTGRKGEGAFSPLLSGEGLGERSKEPGITLHFNLDKTLLNGVIIYKYATPKELNFSKQFVRIYASQYYSL
jgi:hypothetical protein